MMELLPPAGDLLGYSIAIVFLLIAVLWHYSDTSPVSIPDISSALLVGAAILVTAITLRNGFIQVVIDSLSPVFEVLNKTVGTPPRFKGTIRYAPSDVLRVIVTVPVLLYATYRDMKERIVRDWVWYPLFLFGLVIMAYDFMSGNIRFLSIWVLGNALFAGVTGIILFKTRMFGGADMKAIWALAIIMPTYPSIGVSPYLLPPVLPDPYVFVNMFSLTILANTAIFAALWPIYMATKNISKGTISLDRPGLILTAEKEDIETATGRYGKILPLWSFDTSTGIKRFVGLIQSVRFGIDTQFVREYIDWHRASFDGEFASPTDINEPNVSAFLDSDANKTPDGEQKWRTANREEAQDAFDNLLASDSVWMTRGIPFLVPLTLGVLAALTIGDIVYIIMSLI